MREDNRIHEKTWLFTYDNNGNILSKREFAFTLKDTKKLEELSEIQYLQYAYDGDRLMALNSENFVYDILGNPTTYRNINCEWTRGRQLSKYGNIMFEYDGQGRRTKKVGNTTVTYTYDSNGNLVLQDYPQKSIKLKFLYDNSGLCAVQNGTQTYYYRKDVQGDVIALLDSSGKVVVRYSYNAWGSHKVLTPDGSELADQTHIGNLNPFRYRGYYFDVETGLYFLKTRYYDSEVGRFITIDDLQYLDPETINGLNLYAYCGNNPIMAVDPEGTSVQDFLTILERILSGFSGIYNNIAKYIKPIGHITKRGGFGVRAYNRLAKQARAETSQMAKTLGKVATVLAVATLAIDIGASWYKNYKSGSEHWVTDSIVDTLYIGARFAIGYGITALCSLIPVPVLGTALGIGLSIAVDYLITWIVDKTGVLDTVKQWASQVGTALKNGWNQFKNWWNGLWA